tara:strand:+ start:9874 stop:10548 length:675 start_codon:yes stop_codon:yes gene_type:complete
MKNNFTFIYRVVKLAKTWGIIKILIFIPFEIYYGFKLGFNTLFSVSNQELDIDTKDKMNSTEYFPTPYYIAKKSFLLVKNQLKNSKFIDFGAGAGRVLMFVSEFNPKEIIGVEFSKDLYTICKNNLTKYFNIKKNLSWDVICCNAIDFKIKPDHNVFFFYDPFNEKIMQQVLQNIKFSYQNSQREITIIYISPRCSNLFIKMGFNKIFSDINKYNRGFEIFNIK